MAIVQVENPRTPSGPVGDMAGPDQEAPVESWIGRVEKKERQIDGEFRQRGDRGAPGFVGALSGRGVDRQRMQPIFTALSYDILRLDANATEDACDLASSPRQGAVGNAAIAFFSDIVTLQRETERVGPFRPARSQGALGKRTQFPPLLPPYLFGASSKG